MTVIRDIIIIKIIFLQTTANVVVNVYPDVHSLQLLTLFLITHYYSLHGEEREIDNNNIIYYFAEDAAAEQRYFIYLFARLSFLVSPSVV